VTVLKIKKATQYPNLGDDDADEEAMVELSRSVSYFGVACMHSPEDMI
jgi:hypothetical protein